MEIEVKQPVEEYPIQMDFSNKLAPGEKILTVEAKAYLNKFECTDEIIKSCTFKLWDITIELKNGYENNYKVTVVINTDKGNCYERDVLLMVRSY